ncbi:MAG: hypothetical protein WCW35_10465 [Bacteroidota bacterium]|jgi:hypothetical protein
MPSIPLYIPWLINTETLITLTDGKTVEVWEIRHQPDTAMFSFPTSRVKSELWQSFALLVKTKLVRNYKNLFTNVRFEQ